MSAALEFNPVPQSQILEQEASIVLASNDNNSNGSGMATSTVNVPKSSSASRKLLDDKKINLSMALKFLNDPSYGQTIE